MLETYIRDARVKRDPLLMTHIVLGYPSFDASLRLVEGMVEAGVELVELQIPFSEPVADGPVIVRANQASLAAGSTVDTCLRVIETLAARVPIPILVMSYYNILWKRGVTRFVNELSQAGVRGAIVPDLPPEEAGEYVEAMRGRAIDPIFIFSPNTSDARMRLISRYASGFVYCVARKGVTGSQTAFSNDLEAYLSRCRAATSLPLALGFGIGDRTGVDFVRGRADIAVVGTQTLRVLDASGVEAVPPFLRGLRPVPSGPLGSAAV